MPAAMDRLRLKGHSVVEQGWTHFMPIFFAQARATTCRVPAMSGFFIALFLKLVR
jgi:hypothetical protein